MRGDTAIAHILKMEGVEFLSCFPENSLIDEVTKVGIRPIICRQERAGVNIADGFSRINNGKKIGVFAMQSGPGTENAFSGVAQAYSDSVPILLLPGGPDRDRIGVSPVFTGLDNYGQITKRNDMVNLVERIPEMMRRAFSSLRHGKLGPVMVELPKDIASADLPEEAFHYVPVKGHKTAGDQQDVKEAIGLIKKSQNPILWAGQGVFYGEAWDELLEFAELLQLPVMTTLAGKSAFPETHALALGTASNSSTEMADHFLKKADVLLGIGTSFTKSIFSPPIPEGKVIIHCTNNDEDLNKDYICDHAIVGDIKLILRQLIDEAKRQNAIHNDGILLKKEIKTIKDRWYKQWMPKLTSEEVPINPYRVLWDLTHTLDMNNSIVTHDSGSPRDQIVPFFESQTPRGYIGWGKSTQLGYSLGLAMGAKLASPEKTVVTFMGDTAFGMCGMDVETAARSKIGVVIVMVNNGVMGGYEKYMPVATERYNAKSLTGDYTKVAEGLGAHAEKISQPKDIIPAIKRAIKVADKGKPALVEVLTRDYPVLSKF